MRWQELTDLLEQEDYRARAIDMVKAGRASAPWKRINALRHWRAGLRDKTSRARAETVGGQGWNACCQGLAYRQEAHADHLTIASLLSFGDFVRKRLQTLYDEYKAERSASITQLAWPRMTPTGSRHRNYQLRRTTGKRKRPPKRHRPGSPLS